MNVMCFFTLHDWNKPSYRAAEDVQTCLACGKVKQMTWRQRESKRRVQASEQSFLRVLREDGVTVDEFAAMAARGGHPLPERLLIDLLAAEREQQAKLSPGDRA